MFTSQKQKGGLRTAHGLYHDVAIRVITMRIEGFPTATV